MSTTCSLLQKCLASWSFVPLTLSPYLRFVSRNADIFSFFPHLVSHLYLCTSYYVLDRYRKRNTRYVWSWSLIWISKCSTHTDRLSPLAHDCVCFNYFWLLEVYSCLWGGHVTFLTSCHSVCAALCKVKELLVNYSLFWTCFLQVLTQVNGVQLVLLKENKQTKNLYCIFFCRENIFSMFAIWILGAKVNSDSIADMLPTRLLY